LLVSVLEINGAVRVQARDRLIVEGVLPRL
jgi:hypothetical protein